MGKTKQKILSVVATFFIGVSTTNAQNINTPSPTVPFGSNTGYEFGVMPSNLPSGGEYGASQHCADRYTQWYADYVRDCDDGSKRVRWDGENSTVSEGVAYGMIIAAYMGDKALVDGLWKYYKKLSNSNGLMNWQTSGCSTVQGSGAATDAEMDAGMALIVANYQWPNSTSPYNYETEARTFIKNVGAYEVQKPGKPGAYQILPGDSWGDGGNSCRNPGYIAMGYIKCFSSIDTENKDFWDNNVVPANYTLLMANSDDNTGLASDWCSNDGTPGGCGDGGNFGDDASRWPWRIGMDAMWTNDARAKGVCNNIAKYCASKGGAAKAPGNVSITGVGTGSTDLIYRSMFACGVMGADPATSLGGGYTVQSLVDDYYANVSTSSSPYYFPEILHMMSLMVITGNFWKPGSEMGQCSRPDLGSDVSLCGVGEVTLTSNVSAANNRVFAWYNSNGQKIGAETTLLVSTPGEYELRIDSVDCSASDNINVLGVLPDFELLGNEHLCTPSTTTLVADVSGAGLQFEWKRNEEPLLLNKNSLFVYRSGEYSVKVSDITGGCVSVEKQMTITSDAPEAMNVVFCDQSNIELAVIGNGVYDWYETLENGSSQAQGNVFETTVFNKSVTYYVEDNSVVQTTVGLPDISCGQDNKIDANRMIMAFTAYADFTLESVKVDVYNYGGAAKTFDLNLRIHSSADYASTPVMEGVVTTFEGPASEQYKTLEIPFGKKITGNPNGIQYWLSVSKPDNVPFKAHSACSSISFPLKDKKTNGGLVQITGVLKDNAASTTDYGFFYDWKLSTGADCDRVPVTAYIDGDCEGDCPVPACVLDLSDDNQNAMSIYPIPFKDAVTIKTNTKINYSMFDLTGQVLLKGTLDGVGDINTRNLLSGMYLLKIEQGENVNFFKIEKE